ERYLDDVRVAVLQLLGLTDYPLASRLFLLARLGERTRGFFHQEALQVDERQLALELREGVSSEAARSWHERFQSIEVPSLTATGILIKVLEDRLAHAAADTFHRLTTATVEAIAEEHRPSDQPAPERLSAEQLAATYRRRQLQWES